LLVLAAVFGALYFALLGGHPLSNPDEGRYAAIPREMIASDDYVTPRLNGVNYFEKPPLLYWAVAGCFRIFGYNEWAVRMMPALSGLFGVLLTYAAARAWQGRTVGLAAAVVLGSSLLIFALSRILILDMAVAMLIGNSSRLSWSILSPSGTLAGLLANQFGEAQDLQVNSLMYAALVLIAITLLVNLIGEAVLRYTQKKTAGIR
jgi:4-amino-4-deoxy-L-arabinose transferase-like glycosyltransferase